MGTRLKEDERNERIIRGLLKLPENRRCINCNSLGPQYVCTNFWTFVCTTCSGIHREFTHRVKSVSMAKFTSQEVAYLQDGGNQKAREIYLKEWDSKHQSGPDGSNIERLRDFIKHVYVDRRFSGEKRLSRPPSGKMGDRDDPSESRKSEGGSRSPPSEGSRSEYSKSPSGPEIVNDWRREERFGNEPKQEETDAKLNSSPPPVRPVREILGDNATPLVVQPPKLPTTNGAALPSVIKPEEKPTAKAKQETVKSLIDFDDFEASTDEKPTAPQIALSSSVAPSTLDSNWASFEFPNQQTSLQSALSQISLSSAPSSVNEAISFAPNVSSSIPINPSQYQAFGASVTTQSPMEVGASSSAEEIKVPARKELPQDLFTTPYAPYHPPMPYWQPHLMRYNVQAIRTVQPSPFQQPMPSNPFDIGDSLPAPRHPAPPMAIPSYSQQNAAVYPAWMSASAVQPSQTAPPNRPMEGSLFGAPSTQPFPSQGGNPFG